MKTVSSFLMVCGLLAMPALAGTQTENYGIPVLPAPGKVVIDGRFDDWDLTGGLFACNNVEEQRDRHSALADTYGNGWGESGTLPYLRSSHAASRQDSPGQGLQPGDKGGVPGGTARDREACLIPWEHPRAAVAAIEDMVTPPADTRSRGWWHALTLPRAPPAVKQQVERPLFWVCHEFRAGPFLLSPRAKSRGLAVRP